MATRRQSDIEDEYPRRPPATTPDRREQQLIGLAVDLAEKQLVAGTASAQVISHYLKMGSPREQLERERLTLDNDYTKSKIDNMASAKRMEELYEQAIGAMRRYGGDDDGNHDSA